MGETTKMDVLRSFRGTIVDFQLLDESTLALQYNSFFAGTASFLEYAEIMNDFLEGEDLNGIADLQEMDMDTGRIVYHLETSHAMTEVLARSPRPFSARASIELLTKCTEILIIAGYAASISGIENHGNLSFDTIWVEQSGNVQLINYGMAQFDLLAYQRGDIEEPSTASCLFAPPERFGFAQEDPTSDIFSLGQLLFSLLTRQYLYQGSSQDIIAQAKSGIPHTNILQYNLPESLIPIFQKCLHPDPYERFEDFDALHDALQEIDTQTLEGATLEEEITAFLQQEEKAPTLPVRNEEEELRRIEQAEARLLQEEERLKALAQEKEEKALQEEEALKVQKAEEERLREEEEERQRLRQLEEEEQRLIAQEEEIRKKNEPKPPSENWQQKGETLARDLRQKIDALSQKYDQDQIFIMSLTTIEVELLPFSNEENKDWFHRLEGLNDRIAQERHQAQQRQEEEKKRLEEEKEKLRREEEERIRKEKEAQEEKLRKEREAQEERIRIEKEAAQKKAQEEQERIRLAAQAQDASDSLMRSIKDAKLKYTNNRTYQRSLAMIDVDRFQLDEESSQEWLQRLGTLKEKCLALQEEARAKAEEEKEYTKQNKRSQQLKSELEHETLEDELFEQFVQQAKEQIEKIDTESSKDWGLRLDGVERDFAEQKQQAKVRIEAEKQRKKERALVRQYAQDFCSSLDDLVKQYPDDDQLKQDCANLKEEAGEPQEEESSWWRDKISDLETERDAFARMAKKRAEEEKERQEKLSVIRKESQQTVMKIDALAQRYQDDTIFQNALKELKEKAITEPFEPAEWQATLRYVEKDLDTHVEEAQERVIEQQRKEEERRKIEAQKKSLQDRADQLIRSCTQHKENFSDLVLERAMDEMIKEAQHQEGETLSWWGDRLDDLETERNKIVEAALERKEAKEKEEAAQQQRERERELARQYAQDFCSSLDDLVKQYPDDDQLKQDCTNLKEEAGEPQEEESSWWRDKISDLETERDAFARMAKKRAEEEKERQEKLSVIRKESRRTVMKIDAFLQRYQDDTIFQNALKELKEKAITEPFEPAEWQATLRYVEKDLDTHVEEAQERVIAQNKRKEEEEKNRIALDKAKAQAWKYRQELLNLQEEPYDSVFTQAIEDLLAQLDQQENEKGELWLARLTSVVSSKEEALTQAKRRKEQAEQQKKEEERQQKLEEERQRIETEKRELEEKRQRIAVERARIEEERQRRERERITTERKKELREQYEQLKNSIQATQESSSDPVTQEALSCLSDSYPGWIEDEVEAQEQWVHGLEDRYNTVIEEAQVREEEQKRQEALRASIDKTVQEYHSKLATLTQWIKIDPQTKASHEILSGFCRQGEEESLEEWSTRLKDFVPLFEKTRAESQEREEIRVQEEQERQKREEERRKKEEADRLEKEKQEERKALLAKQPTDLGEALSIVHRLYDLYAPSTEDELRPYLKKNLSSVKGWQIALLEELCFSSSCLIWLKDSAHENIRTFIKEQSEHYNKDSLKSMLLLLATSLSLSPPQLESPIKRPQPKPKEQRLAKSESPQSAIKTEETQNQWASNPNWQGPAQSPVFTSGKFQASKNIKKYALIRKKGARPLPFRADPNITTASVIGYLFSQQLLPIRMDLHGAVLGWYRFEQEGKAVSGSVPLSNFSEKKPLRLKFIPNTAQKIYLSIPDQNIETETIIGSTVPFLSLIEIFGSRFSLPHRKWNISIAGKKVDPYHMLYDFKKDEQIRITML